MLPGFLQRVVDALERLAVPYAVTGSWASTTYGLPRTTHDLDLVVALPEDKVQDLADAFAPPVYADAAWMRSAIAAGEMFNLIDPVSGLKVDCWPVRDEPYAREQFARRRRIDVAGSGLWMLSAEDIILAKLAWHAQAPSDTQWRDVLGVLRAQGDGLDRAYLAHWAARLGLSQLLEHAGEQAG